jgi:hypothetical protein
MIGRLTGTATPDVAAGQRKPASQPGLTGLVGMVADNPDVIIRIYNAAGDLAHQLYGGSYRRDIENLVQAFNQTDEDTMRQLSWKSDRWLGELYDLFKGDPSKLAVLNSDLRLFVKALLAMDRALLTGDNASKSWENFARSEAAKRLDPQLVGRVIEFLIFNHTKQLKNGLTNEEAGLNCVGVHTLASRIAARFGLKWEVVYVKGLKEPHVALIDTATGRLIELSIRGDRDGRRATLAKRYEDARTQGEGIMIILFKGGSRTELPLGT